jgi:hypothetical protein
VSQRAILDDAPQVRYHDLTALAREVQQTYFPQTAPLQIRWGRKVERKRRRSIRLGSYHRNTAVIRIHPLLNSADVPLYFVQSIIFHEYLHHVLGPNHNLRFHRDERRFRFYRESKQWLRLNLSMLLGKRSKAVVGRGRRLSREPRATEVQLRLF